MTRTITTIVTYALLATMPGATGVAQAQTIVDDQIARGEFDVAYREADAALQLDPDNVQARFQRARASTHMGNHQAALRDYDRLVRAYPENVDYRFGRAQVLARQERDEEALAELAIAAELAPAYEDVWRLRLQVARRSERNEQVDALQKISERRFPQADWWRPVETIPVPAFTLTLGAEVSSLSRSGPSPQGWNTQFLDAGWQATDSWMLTAGLRRSQRFGLIDTGYYVGAEKQIDDDWTAGLRAGRTAGADFLAERDYGAHLVRRLPAGWGLQLGLARREYRTANVNTVSLQAERYFGQFRATYRLAIARLQNAGASTGHGASITWYYRDTASAGLAISTGEEAELVAPGQVLNTDVNGLSIFGRHQLTNSLSLDWWVGVHDQGNFYRRRYGGVAGTFRF